MNKSTRSILYIGISLFMFHLNTHTFAQTLFSNEIESELSTMNTSDKPQSKIWKHDNTWWAVFPNKRGTHLWKLGTDKQWTQTLKISSNTTTKADCKKNGNDAHILLFNNNKSELISVSYNPENKKYNLSNLSSTAIKFNFNSSTETATIDIDKDNVMWMAYEEDNNIKVNSSPYPYKTWGQPTVIATNVKNDDICSIIAFPEKIGVLWSNQNSKFFGFKTHRNGDNQSIWSKDEKPASQSQLDIEAGMSDDHINMAISKDGTLFCAVKTSFDTKGYPLISLLKRNSNGTWDDLYYIDDSGTRPIVIINNTRDKVQVVYTDVVSGGNIVYKESSTSNIAFGNKHIIIEGAKLNNASSSKENYEDEALIIASTQNSPFYVVGSIIKFKHH